MMLIYGGGRQFQRWRSREGLERVVESIANISQMPVEKQNKIKTNCLCCQGQAFDLDMKGVVVVDVL